METLNASEAKQNFGEVLLKAQRAPVGINKNGKPVAVMVSAGEYAELESLRGQFLQQQIDMGVADIQAGRVADGNEVIERLRQHVLEAELYIQQNDVHCVTLCTSEHSKIQSIHDHTQDHHHDHSPGTRAQVPSRRIVHGHAPHHVVLGC